MLVLAMQFSRVDGDARRLEGHRNRAEAPALWEGREPETPKCPTQMRGARAVRLPQNGIVMPDIRDPVVPTRGPLRFERTRRRGRIVFRMPNNQCSTWELPATRWT
jgi:hypothetical protein